MKFDVKVNRVSSAGQTLEFDGDTYETDDPEEIAFLMNLSDDVVAIAEAEAVEAEEPKPAPKRKRAKKDD